MSVRSRAAAILILLVSVVSAAAVFSPFGCALVGGRWGKQCLLPPCYYLGGCGHWAGPAVPCEALAVGASRAHVHFLFGDPDVSHGNTEKWEFGKAASYPVVTYSNEHVSSVECPGSTQS